MFPGTTVRSSSGERVVDRVGASPDLVVATVGAEPVADEGYAAVVVLDTWLSLARDDLRAAEEALRRWFNAAALVRRGGQPFSRSRRPRSRFQLRSFSVWRLSWSFLPRPSPISTFARPRSLK